jgi:hypothetical protein
MQFGQKKLSSLLKDFIHFVPKGWSLKVGIPPFILWAIGIAGICKYFY